MTAMAAMRVQDIRIKDLLDFSLPPASSIAPGNVRPLSVGTVHHHPLNYIPNNERTGPQQAEFNPPRSFINVKTEKDEKCPNVCVRNGVICAPYQRVKTEGGMMEREGVMIEMNVQAGGTGVWKEETKGSSLFQSPPLDNQFSENITTKQLLRRLYLTKKLLSLKKLSLKNQAMAVNLENLLPQALQESGYAVPTNGSEDVTIFGDIISPSMYSNDFASIFESVGDVLTFDPAPGKGDTSSLTPVDGSEGVGYVEGFGSVYQAGSPDIFDNSWMTTSTPLPLTPEEPSGVTTSTTLSSLPPPITPYTTAPYLSHAPNTGGIPLTPDSLVSPQSSGEGEEIDDVLSYFAESADGSSVQQPLEGYEYGSGFPSPGAAAVAYGTPYVYTDSPHSSTSYTSLSSNSPTSPASYAPATPTNYTPVTSPLSSSTLTHQAITPSDTIRDLLAREAEMKQQSSSSSVPIFTPRGANALKRKPETLAPEPAKRPAKSTGRKRISVSVKKERKREQNKTAALRYRQKKKEEKMEYDQQQQELEEKNAQLKTTLKGLEAEVSYLKRLWTEVERAKLSRVM